MDQMIVEKIVSLHNLTKRRFSVMELSGTYALFIDDENIGEFDSLDSLIVHLDFLIRYEKHKTREN